MLEYACDLEIAQNSNCLVSIKFLVEILTTCRHSFQAHCFSSFNLRWLKIRRESEFEVLKASNCEPSQDHMHIPTYDIDSIDVFWGYPMVATVE